MKRAALVLWIVAMAGCAHAIRNVADCGDLDAVKRVECSACTVQNKADGLLGEYEYKPGNDAGARCVRIK